MKKIIISDVTLRDGNHAVNHSINLNIIKQYCQFAEKAKLSVIEVGHGNGIGASSLSIGRSAFPDKKILRVDGEGNPYRVFFSKETVKKLAQNYLMKKYK